MTHLQDEERDCIVDALVEHGVTYLAGGRGLPSAISDAELIRTLVESDDARLRLAIIPLFLSRPDLNASVPAIIKQLSPERALDLKQRYMAAVCLQRFWRTRLNQTIGQNALLPDLYSGELGLPSLNVQHGKHTLNALAKQMSRTHDEVDYLASFNKTFEHFIRQREIEMLDREPASAR